jgi:hypothetical protein
METKPASTPHGDTNFWRAINGQVPVLFKPGEHGLMPTDGEDRYSVIGCSTVLLGGKQRFIAPHLMEILAKSGQKFELHP